MFDHTHAHITTWVLALVLFAIALFLQQSGKQKGAKIVHMVLRLFYLLVIATGLMLFIRHQSFNAALYGMKFLGGIVVISMMEMILVRLGKNKKTTAFWIVFILALAATFYLGLELPLGWTL